MDALERSMAQEWIDHLTGKNERLARLLEQTEDEGIKAEYEADFAANRKMITQFDALKNREEPKQAPLELAMNASYDQYVKAVLAQKPLEGAAKELNAELELKTEPFGDTGHEVEIPWEAAVGSRIMDGDIEFADAVTSWPLGSANAPKNRERILGRLFKDTILGFLGISSPSVSMGEMKYPYLTSGPSAGAVAPGSGKDAQIYTYGMEEARLRTITAGAVVEKETLVTYGDRELNSLIRNDLEQVLIAEKNNLALNGSGSGNEPTGLLARIGTADFADGKTGATADDVALDWKRAQKALWVHRADPEMKRVSQFRYLFGLDTDTFLHGLFREPTGDLDAIDKMLSRGARVDWSGYMPAPDPDVASGTSGIVQEALLVSDFASRNIIAPTWVGYVLLVDPYTDAKTRKTAFWAHSMFDMAYRRSPANTISGAKRLKYVLSDKA